MKVTGIICEYNPFHNGHRYHIEETGKLTCPDYIIGVMSGNFTQRGIPAIVDKYSRTHMALMGGCDVIIELPARYATSSAEGFACAAVSLLEATGVCDSICFGSEHGDLESLNTVAGILRDEPMEYSKHLATYLRKGESYPRARELALTDYCGHDIEVSFEPNNILAIEYLKACTGTGITPYTIKRTDNGYHSDTSSEDMLSAEAIRNNIFAGSDITAVSDFIPDYTAKLLNDTVNPEQFSSVLYYSLLNNLNCLEQYLDISGDLADRIRNNINSFTGFNSFIELIKTKNLTYTRVTRALIHCLLGITGTAGNTEKYPVPYIRILGFRRNSSALMKAIQKNASVPVITRPARPQMLSSTGMGLLAEDIKAAELYNHIRYLGRAGASQRLQKNEYTHGIIIL